MTGNELLGLPALLVPDGEIGRLAGASNRYEKRLADLAGLYRDGGAFAAALVADDGEPVYWVESSTVSDAPGALTVGVSSLRAGTIGDEFAMTRGHIHVVDGAAELYYGLAGRGVMLMETLDGQHRALEVTPGVAVHVPGGWVHRSVNVGEELFSTLFCYGTDAGQDYEVIQRAGGMSTLIVCGADGEWTARPNPEHRGYQRADSPTGAA